MCCYGHPFHQPEYCRPRVVSDTNRIDQPIDAGYPAGRQPTATLNGCHVAIVCYIKRYAVSRATPDAYLIT